MNGLQVPKGRGKKRVICKRGRERRNIMRKKEDSIGSLNFELTIKFHFLSNVIMVTINYSSGIITTLLHFLCTVV